MRVFNCSELFSKLSNQFLQSRINVQNHSASIYWTPQLHWTGKGCPDSGRVRCSGRCRVSRVCVQFNRGLIILGHNETRPQKILGFCLLFDHCAKCQSCCRVEDAYGSLEITLTQIESKRFRNLCIEDHCEYLGTKGCTLGDQKPLSCKLYPLSFDPDTKKYFFDVDCPLLTEYKRQLKDPKSDASQHMREMNTLLFDRSVVDEDFLRRNRQIDVSFFDLIPISKPRHLKYPANE